jgi:hypothetical protein
VKNLTAIIRDAVNELCARNERVADQRVAEMFLGHGIFVARLGTPKVIEGQWTDVVDNTADLFDLMDDYQAGRGNTR